MSHGCSVVGRRRRGFTGWPSLVVDVDPVANRIMPWLAYKYGIRGELYYDTVELAARQRFASDGRSASGGAR